MNDVNVVAVLSLDEVVVDVPLWWSPMMVFDRFADVNSDVDLLEVLVVDVELVYLHKDVLDDAGWESGVDDPRTLDIRLGSKSQDILPDDVVL